MIDSVHYIPVGRIKNVWARRAAIFATFPLAFLGNWVFLAWALGSALAIVNWGIVVGTVAAAWSQQSQLSKGAAQLWKR